MKFYKVWKQRQCRRQGLTIYSCWRTTEPGGIICNSSSGSILADLPSSHSKKAPTYSTRQLPAKLDRERSEEGRLQDRDPLVPLFGSLQLQDLPILHVTASVFSFAIAVPLLNCYQHSYLQRDESYNSLYL